MKNRLNEDSGFTLIEFLLVTALIGILTGTALYNLKVMSNPLQNASNSVEQFMHLARARAISGTQVVKVTVTTAKRLDTATSDSCSGTMTPLPTLFLDLPVGSTLTTTTPTVCFTQRGLADVSTNFVISDNDGDSRTVRVALGGGTIID